MGRLLTFLISYVIYLLLTWIPDRQELIVGFIISLGICLIFGDIISPRGKKLLSPKRYFYFIYYIPVFLYYVIKANVDVAYRVLHPKLPINPGIVKVKTNLKNELALTVLANSITLTPGTLSVDISEGYMYIHWIDVKAKDMKRATDLIIRRFERIIKEVFE